MNSAVKSALRYLAFLFFGIAIGWLATKIIVGQSAKQTPTVQQVQDSAEVLDLNTITIDEPNTAETNFAKACRGGIIAACYNWGFRKMQLGNKTDTRKLYGHACKNGYQMACNALKML